MPRGLQHLAVVCVDLLKAVFHAQAKCSASPLRSTRVQMRTSVSQVAAVKWICCGIGDPSEAW